MYRDKWEALNPGTRKALEILFGILTAGLTGFFLISSSGDDGSWGAFAALAVALMLPRMGESLVGDKLPLMRRALLIGLVIVVGVTLVLAIRAPRV